MILGPEVLHCINSCLFQILPSKGCDGSSKGSVCSTSFTEELISERTFWWSTNISLRQLIGVASWFLQKNKQTKNHLNWWREIILLGGFQLRVGLLIPSTTDIWGWITFRSEKAMASHSSTLAWKIPWMEKLGRLQSMGSLTVRHDWATSLSLFTFMHWRRKMATHSSVLAWRIPGMGSLVGCRPWGCTESATTEVT